MDRLKDYLGELIDAKQRRPTDDLLGRLVVDQLQTGALTRPTLISMALLLLVAGHETTANMITLGAFLFLEHPDQLALLRSASSPRVGEQAVEEILRYMTIVQYSPARVATADVEIGGELIRAGEGVFALIESANRDDSVFVDPDAFDITEPRRHHLAFGYGSHQCVGQWLARLELQIALASLFSRAPSLALATPVDEIPFKHDMTVYGAHELWVRW
jgi:cytochrome P450